MGFGSQHTRDGEYSLVFQRQHFSQRTCRSEKTLGGAVGNHDRARSHGGLTRDKPKAEQIEEGGIHKSSVDGKGFGVGRYFIAQPIVNAGRFLDKTILRFQSRTQRQRRGSHGSFAAFFLLDIGQDAVSAVGVRMKFVVVEGLFYRD